MITSCSPGWVKFCEHYYPDLIPHLSTCKSPQQMQGAMIKSYYAEKAIEYLAGKKTIYVYRGIWVILVFVGAVVDLSLVWNIADGTNALMAIPNLISLLLLSGVIAAETKKYLWDKRLDDYDDSEIPEIDD